MMIASKATIICRASGLTQQQHSINTTKGCAATYYPEANVLVHKDLVARESTPGYKAIPLRFEKTSRSHHTNFDRNTKPW